jgi:hypothetical protein
MRKLRKTGAVDQDGNLITIPRLPSVTGANKPPGWNRWSAAEKVEHLLGLSLDRTHLFFQLVSRRYERGSMLITSNRSIGEWGTVFGDAVVATAILDRLLHHSHVLTIRGDSYRLREKRRTGLLKAPLIAQSVPVPA